MGILDGIVEWIAEQVMAGLDLITDVYKRQVYSVREQAGRHF